MIASHLDKPFGFTCQTWLATDLADRYFGSTYRVWFATSLNPPQNGASSNPLIIYDELDRIIQTNDYNHSRIDQLRRRLSGWINGTHLPSATIADLLQEIKLAPMTAFRPCIWKIDLTRIDLLRMIKFGQFPDEYQISDLVAGEFEVVTP